MHIDMDAFFASVEQHDQPALCGLPVIVGGGARGVVSASSYEARKYGVRSAMPMFMARKLCPKGCFVPVRMRRYMEVSRQIITVLKEFTPLVEQVSVDEAFLDAGELVEKFGPPEELAALIKQAIYGVSGLTSSVGLAPLKFLAKIASDLNKPDGISVIYPEQVDAFLQTLPLERIPGVGRQTMKIMQALGVLTAGDMRKYPQSFWERRLGKMGALLYQRACGIDQREIVTYRAPKSESAENTFPHNTRNLAELEGWLRKQAARVSASLRKQGFAGRTITLKVKFADFSQITRSKSLEQRVADEETIYNTASALLQALELEQDVRLVGLGVSNFDATERQIQLKLPQI